MCSHGINVVASKNNSSAHFRVNCGSWDCQECRSRMQAEHSARCHDIFQGSMAAYRSVVPERQWTTIYSRIFRAISRYVCLELGDGMLLVFTDRQVTGSVQVSSVEAIKEIETTIELFCKPEGCLRYRPISYHRSWSEHREPSGWKKIGYAAASSFRHYCRLLNLKTRDVSLPGLEAIFAAATTSVLDVLKQLVLGRGTLPTALSLSGEAISGINAFPNGPDGPSLAEELQLKPNW